MIPSFFKVGISALSAGVITLIVGYYYGDRTIGLLVGDTSSLLSRDFYPQFMQFLFLALVYGFTFFSFAYLYQAKDALELLNNKLFKNRIQRNGE